MTTFQQLVAAAIEADCPILQKMDALRPESLYLHLDFVGLAKLATKLVQHRQDFLEEISSRSRGLTEWRRWKALLPCPVCGQKTCPDAPLTRLPPEVEA